MQQLQSGPRTVQERPNFISRSGDLPQITFPVLGLKRLPIILQWPAGLLLIALAAWFDYTQYQAILRIEMQVAWVQLIIFVIVLVLNELLRPDPPLENARPGGVGDFSFPTATEGRTQPLLWGTNRISGPNTIWYGDIRADPINQRVQTGLWSSKKFVRGYDYFVGFQMGLCRGPGVELIELFIGEDKAYSGPVVTGEDFFDINEPNLFGGSLGQGGVLATVDFYPGSDTQTVSPYLDTVDKQRPAPLASAPRYTRLSHIVVREQTSAAPTSSDEGASIGTSTTVRPWRVVARRMPAPFAGQSVGDNVIATNDANPINVIYEILTNTEWGQGFSAGEIDTGASGTFKLAADEMVTEVHGFSLLLDRSMSALALLGEIERQIDGLVYLNPATGKWSMALARENSPWTAPTPRTIDESSSSFKDFTRGSWEDTTNTINIKYWKRADDYKESHAVAIDMANIQIQGAGSILTGKTTVAKMTYPGIKTGALASNIAWRTLRVMSFPIARATLFLDRSFWDVIPGEVLEWTNASLGLIDFPVRVSSVNYGKLNDGLIECAVVQDIFRFAPPSYGAPGSSQWIEPTLLVVAFPTAQQFAEEAPRAIVVRDPEFVGDPAVSKVHCRARRQTIEGHFDIVQRNSSGAPSGAFAFAGDVASFVLIGNLLSALNAGSNFPLATITIETTPDTQVAILAEFATASLTDMGQQLVQLIKVGNEYMAVESAVANGANVDLNNVYRGFLDSAQEDHLSTADVELMFVGAGLTDGTFPSTHNVDIKLLPVSSKDKLAEGSATTIALTMAKRTIRPYPPSATLYNGSGTPFGTPSLEGAGSGLNGFRIDVALRRRRFDTLDELAELLANFTPDATTDYEVELRHTPFGGGDIIETKAFQAGTTTEQFLRTTIVDGSPGNAVDVELQIRVRTRHDILTETDLFSRYVFTHRFTPTSALSGQFALGSVTWSTPTNTYTAVATGTFTVNIGTAYTTGAVSASINGGTFNSVIATGLVTGTIVGVVATDTIRLRHDAQDLGPGLNFVELQNPSASAVAYGIFID